MPTIRPRIKWWQLPDSMKLTYIFIYGFAFAVAFLIFALVWHWQMSDVYFVSRDKGVITDFFPPFVHDGASGDFFIKPPRVIYTIWAVYLAAVLIIPAVCAWLLVRLHQRALNKAWM
jgi:hypothetical protein